MKMKENRPRAGYALNARWKKNGGDQISHLPFDLYSVLAPVSSAQQPQQGQEEVDEIQI